jgi:hypothetical protein
LLYKANDGCNDLRIKKYPAGTINIINNNKLIRSVCKSDIGFRVRIIADARISTVTKATMILTID